MTIGLCTEVFVRLEIAKFITMGPSDELMHDNDSIEIEDDPTDNNDKGHLP